MSSKSTGVTVGGGERNIVKGSKPSYEAPCVVPLGELARGSGKCSPGSGQAGTNCNPGAIVEGGCHAGLDAAA